MTFLLHLISHTHTHTHTDAGHTCDDNVSAVVGGGYNTYASHATSLLCVFPPDLGFD